MTIIEFLGKLSGVRKNGVGWIAFCPAHEDRNPSLSINECSEDELDSLRVAFVRSKEAQAYVTGRGISLAVAMNLRWGFHLSWNFIQSPNRLCALVIPHYVSGKLAGLKARTISGPKHFSQKPGSRMAGLYAADLLDLGARDESKTPLCGMLDNST